MRKISKFSVLSIILSIMLALFSTSMLISMSPPAKASDSDFANSTVFIQAFKDLCDAYPTLASYNTSGYTTLGKPMVTFFVGKGPTKIMIDGAIHAWEYYSGIIIYKLAQWALTNYSSMISAREMLDRCTLILTPTVNLDEWPYSRKNADGVDLNRNFLNGWENGDSNSSSDFYHGPSPASENETKTLRNMMEEYAPSAYVNCHINGGTNGTAGTLIWEQGYTTAFNTTCWDIYNNYSAISQYQGIPINRADDTYTEKGYAIDDAMRNYTIPACFMYEMAPDNQTPDTNAKMPLLRALVSAIIDHFPNAQVFGMKTTTNGYFYWPNETVSYIKIESWFTNVSAVGDQVQANRTGYSFYFPDNKKDGKDIAMENLHFGDYEGSSTWNYMYDINADHKVDGKDIALASMHFGEGSTTWYSTNMTRILVTLVCNDSITEYGLYPITDGWCHIPTGQTYKSMYIDNWFDNSSILEVGAFITFWN